MDWGVSLIDIKGPLPRRCNYLVENNLNPDYISSVKVGDRIGNNSRHSSQHAERKVLTARLEFLA